MLSAALIVLVVRTRGLMMTTPPSRALATATATAVAAALALPFMPIAGVLGFGPVPGRFLGAMGLIVICYIVAAEVAKRRFYRLPLFPV